MALLPLVTFPLAPVTCYVLQKLIEPAIYINSVCVVKAVGCGADEENPARDGLDRRLLRSRSRPGGGGPHARGRHATPGQMPHWQLRLKQAHPHNFTNHEVIALEFPSTSSASF